MEKLTKQKAIQFILEHPEETNLFYMQEIGCSQSSITLYKREIKEKGLTLDNLDGFGRNSIEEKLNKILSLMTEPQQSTDLVQANADLLEKIRVLEEEKESLTQETEEMKEKIRVQSLTQETEEMKEIRSRYYFLLKVVAALSVRSEFFIISRDGYMIDPVKEDIEQQKKVFETNPVLTSDYVQLPNKKSSEN